MGKSTVAVAFEGKINSLRSAAGEACGLLGGFIEKATSGPALIGAAFVGVGAGLFKLGEGFQEQFNKISTGTGATGKALDVLKTDFKNVAKDMPDSFDKVGTAITTVTQKLGLTGKPLEEVSKQFLDLSRITKTDLTANIQAATGVFNQFKIKGEEQKTTLDELYRATQVSGLSFGDLTSQISGSANVFQALGFSVEQATTMVAGLGKEGLSTADIMPALSKTLAAGAKEGKSAQSVYQDLIASIKKAPDATTAAEIGFKELGAKAGPKFAEMVRSGKLSFDELGQSIAEGSDTIDKGAKRAETFGEKWSIIKNRVLVGLEPLATGVFNGMGAAMDHLGPIIDTLSAGLSKVGDFVSNNKAPFEVLAGVIGGVLTAAFVSWGVQAGIAAAASVAGFISTQIQAAISAASTVASMALVVAGWVAEGVAATASGAAMAAAWIVGMGPIGLVVAAIAGAALLIVTHWDQIKDAAKAVWDWISTNWPLILAILTGPIGLAVKFIVDHWDQIKAGFTAVKDWIGARISDVVGFFTGLPGRIAGAVTNAFQHVKDAMTSAKNWVSDRVGDVVNFFKELPGKMLSALGNLGSILFDAGKKIIGGLISGLGSAIGGVKDTLGNLASDIVSWKGPPEADLVLLVDNGQRIIRGLISGIQSQSGPLQDLLGQIGSMIVSQFSNIQTPSLGGLSGLAAGGLSQLDPKSASAINDRIVSYLPDSMIPPEGISSLAQSLPLLIQAIHSGQLNQQSQDRLAASIESFLPDSVIPAQGLANIDQTLQALQQAMGQQTAAVQQAVAQPPPPVVLVLSVDPSANVMSQFLQMLLPFLRVELQQDRLRNGPANTAFGF